jgi:DNA-binding SARP family transcriptional activator
VTALAVPRTSDSRLLLTTRPTELQLLGRPRIYGKRRSSTRLPNLCWAVAAVLATADEPITRDSLLLLLWPESTVPRARAALSQVLYLLRRNLGPEAIVTDGDFVALNRDVIGSDVRCFRHQIKAGEPRSALSEYRGPFLADVSFRKVPEFESWVAARREEFSAIHRRCLRTLIDESRRGGHVDDAIEFLSALATAYPSDVMAAAELDALRRVTQQASSSPVLIPNMRPLANWITGAAAGLAFGLLLGSELSSSVPPSPQPSPPPVTSVVDSPRGAVPRTRRVAPPLQIVTRPTTIPLPAVVDLISASGGGGMDPRDCTTRVVAFCEPEPIVFYRTKRPDPDR